MDPRILQLLMQRQQAQGAGGQPQAEAMPMEEEAPMEDDGFSLGDGEFDSNPFEQFMAQQGGGQSAPQSAPAQGGGEAPQDPQMAAYLQQIQQDPKRNQLAPGGNPGTTKYLLSAMQQLQGYIAESTDRDEIAVGRSIIQLLVRLIDQDQTNRSSELESAPEGGAPAGPQAPIAPEGGMK